MKIHSLSVTATEPAPLIDECMAGTAGHDVGVYESKGSCFRAWAEALWAFIIAQSIDLRDVGM